MTRTLPRLLRAPSLATMTPTITDSDQPLAMIAARLKALRAALAAAGLDGFLVPHADNFQSEYLPAYAERLAWLTDFTGSAGAAIVLADKAAVFVDGRYTLQAKAQIDGALFDICHLIENSPQKWLADAAKKGQRIGYDPWLHTKSQLARFEKQATQAGIELIGVAQNPIDLLWADQPAPPNGPYLVHAERFAGTPAAEKCRAIAEALKEEGDRAVILTTGASVAWLLNIRGSDVAHTPLPLAYAAIEQDGSVCLFAAAEKISSALLDHLGARVRISNPDSLGKYLDGLAKQGGRVRVSPEQVPQWIFARLTDAGAVLHEAADPCALPRAIKNDVELAGARAAHIRDGVAMARFLSWLDREAPGGKVDEIGAADRLEAFRRDGDLIEDLSFPTISGARSNGAIVHYMVTPATNAPLGEGLYLVDSGAQYLDGTTDITRTVAIGAPDDEMRTRFTQVLKGHIALATTLFPKGTRGSQLDVLARQFLWAAGADFDHGTGHGVGSYLGVHEGPQRISKTAGDADLKPGMILSNEPGYYKEGAFGIRIENLLEVVEMADHGEERRAFLGFSVLTRAPIDRRLIDRDMLTDEETGWIDAYHAKVLADIGDALSGADAAWLEAATLPLDI